MVTETQAALGLTTGVSTAPTKRRRLKPRHAAFAVHCARTGNRAEAVRLAGYTTAFPSRQAYVLMQKPGVRQAVNQARAVLAEVDAMIAAELLKIADGDPLRLLRPPVVGTRKRNVAVICHPAPATERHIEIIGALSPFDPMIGWPGVWFCKTAEPVEHVLDAVMAGQIAGGVAWTVIEAAEFCFGGVPAEVSDDLRTRRVRSLPLGAQRVPWDPDAVRSVIDGQEL